MKLRNKKTGEIYDFKITPDYDDVMSGWKIENKDFGVRYYSHLAELNAEWEDATEEPKGCWIINIFGVVEYTHFRNEAEVELLNRKKDEVQKEIDSYSRLFPDECVEYRNKLDKEYQELEQSIQKAKNQLYKDIKGGKE